MERERIAALLKPFAHELVSDDQLAALAAYLDLLLRWNERINLTSVRAPEEIVTRHFGESVFAAEQLLERDEAAELCDVGSGAGFPGLPLKIVRPQARVTLVEAHGKKATFLKEAVRATKLTGVAVVAQRAEEITSQFDVVTLRAVERFGDVLPVAADLVKAGGRLGLLIGSAQLEEAKRLMPKFNWKATQQIPQSHARVLLIGEKLQP